MPTLAKNKKGLFNYEVLEEYEAGIVLEGPEVKSVKAGQISLAGSYATIDSHNDVWLKNAHISPYQPAKGSQANYNPTRDRKLLLNNREIARLAGTLKSGKGLTIIPTFVYTKGSLIKLKIAIARGKRKVDKRESIKQREAERAMRRAMKRR